MALAVAAVLVLTQPLISRADDLFQLFWRGVYYTRNSSGHIIAVKFTEQDFVNKVAQDNGLNPADLVFVYRPDKRDTAVVRASNGAFIADWIQMEFTFTDISNPTGSVIVRHALLFDENHQAALGSFTGYEMRTLTSSGSLANDFLSGFVEYGLPDQGLVYQATVSTGKRIVDTSG
jgi:hypothetical protein